VHLLGCIFLQLPERWNFQYGEYIAFDVLLIFPLLFITSKRQHCTNNELAPGEPWNISTHYSLLTSSAFHATWHLFVCSMKYFVKMRAGLEYLQRRLNCWRNLKIDSLERPSLVIDDVVSYRIILLSNRKVPEIFPLTIFKGKRFSTNFYFTVHIFRPFWGRVIPLFFCRWFWLKSLKVFWQSVPYKVGAVCSIERERV